MNISLEIQAVCDNAGVFKDAFTPCKNGCHGEIYSEELIEFGRWACES
jgi:hypothetical protein